MSDRPTQYILCVPLLIATFRKKCLLMVGADMHEFSSASKHSNLCITHHGWIVEFYLINMIRRKCFVPVRYQHPTGKLEGLALQYFGMVHKVGRIERTKRDQISHVHNEMEIESITHTKWVKEHTEYDTNMIQSESLMIQSEWLIIRNESLTHALSVLPTHMCDAEIEQLNESLRIPRDALK